MTTISIDYNDRAIWVMDGISPMAGDEMGDILATVVPSRTALRILHGDYSASVSVADWGDFASLLQALGHGNSEALLGWVRSDFVAGHGDTEFETGEAFEPASVGFVRALLRGFTDEIAESWDALLSQHEED